MIGIRRMLERGREHPLLGPVVVIVLVLLLALVFIHAIQHTGQEWDLGSVFLAVITVLGVTVLALVSRICSRVVELARDERGPPWLSSLRPVLRPPQAAATLAIPLRR